MSTEPGLRERKKQAMRRNIAETAVAMFLERGFDAVPVSEVAAAAGVSKMTVFNHFPAKEDLVFEFSGRSLPDLAGAVRGRAQGQSAIEAVRGLVRADFIERGKRDAQEDRVAAFLRMAFGSPTLLEAFGRQWSKVQNDLGSSLAEATGQSPPPPDVERSFLRAVRGEGGADEMAAWLRGMDETSMLPFFAAGQIVSALQQITMTNLVRVGAGVPLRESTTHALRDIDAAFGLLERGLADYAIAKPSASLPRATTSST